MTQLKEEIVKRISDEPQLLAKVTEALKVHPSSMAYILRKKTTRLIEYPVVKAIAEYTGLEEDEILEYATA